MAHSWNPRFIPLPMSDHYWSGINILWSITFQPPFHFFLHHPASKRLEREQQLKDEREKPLLFKRHKAVTARETQLPVRQSQLSSREDGVSGEKIERKISQKIRAWRLHLNGPKNNLSLHFGINR